MLLMAWCFLILEVALLIGLVLAYRKLTVLNGRFQSESPALLTQMREGREQIKALNVKLEATDSSVKGLLKNFGWQGQVALAAFKLAYQQTQARMSLLK
mgnify:CR=1 FL=1